MKNKIPENALKRYSERGLTAVELLVSMAIFLIVVGAVYGVLRIGNMSRSSINSRSENIKNVRMATNSIGREAVNAGLGYNRIGGTVPDDFTSTNFGLPPDADGDQDLLTAISAGYNISESDLSKSGAKNDVVAFAFRDFQFNDGFPIVINDAQKSNGNLVLKTPDGACVNCRPYDLFLIESGDGKKAIILSTDIVGNNTIVLGDDPLGTNYGNTSSGNANGGGESGKGEDSKGYCLPGHYGHKHCTNPPGIYIGIGGIGITIGGGGSSGSGSGSGSGSSDKTDNSSVKKCDPGETQNCLNYTTSVVAKKIYLVSYGVRADGTLTRTTFGNNTGAGAEDQIVTQPIASGVRSFKLKYLLADGTTTEDPSVANTQKEKCNDIIQIEVSVTVDSEKGNEPITLNSTFSTRNLKYDVY